MWQILKAEFRYIRDALILTYLIAAAFLIVAIVMEWGVYNFMWNTAITYFIFMGISAGTATNEKRYRYLCTLPVTVRELAVVDLLYVTLVQAGMCVLWIIYLFFRPESVKPETLWAMLANNATILSVVTIFGIHYHLGFFETKKYKRFNWCLLLTFVLAVAELGYFHKLDGVAKAVWRYYASGRGALTSFMICGWLLLLCGSLFERRKSYLA